METKEVQGRIGLLLVGVIAISSAFGATPNTEKLSPQIASISQAVANGKAKALQQESITKQLRGQNGLMKARWNSAGQVQVYIYYDRSSVAPDMQSLSKLGATDLRDTPLLGVVQAWVPANKLAAVVQLPWVRRVTEPRYLKLNSYYSPLDGRRRPESVDTTGDNVMGAAAFRQATGMTGSGVTVGVISGDAAGLSQSQAAGNLPSNVWVDPNLPGATSEGEGTAMMEIVHQLAPGAGLAFCGPSTSADFINCISDLGTKGSANVIVDDLAIPLTAYFTYDSDVLAIQQWQAQHPTVRLVTATGNFAEAFWSGTWNPTALSTSINGVTYSETNNFGTNASPVPYLAITVNPNDTIEYILQWDDPWVLTSDVTSTTPDDPNDYDLVLADFSGNVLACVQGNTTDSTGCSQAGAASSTSPGPQPAIGNIWTNNSSSATTVYLYVLFRNGSPGSQLKIFVGSENSCDTVINPVNPIGSIVGHATLSYPAEISVGAVNVNTPGAIEPFSSLGPVNLPLFSSAPIMKPDFVATDGVTVSGAGGFPQSACGFTPTPPPTFFGTSAAAPHIAALIALLESAGYSSDDVYSVLQKYSVKLGSSTPNGIFGYGRPNISTAPSNISQSGGSGSSGGGKSGGGGDFGESSLLIIALSLVTRRRLMSHLR